MRTHYKKAISITLLIVLMLIFTRVISVSHNIGLSPDEPVFFSAAQSLKGFIFGSSSVYEEVKEYPEGAIVLQLPFHILTALINRFANTAISPALSGRIASVFYFICGTILGCFILYKFFSKKLSTLVVYGLITVFSIMHIEQSRYGTGDPISFFLLMLLIYLAASALSSEQHYFILIVMTFFVTGMLTAVKYPLVSFGVIPVYASFFVWRKKVSYTHSFNKLTFVLISIAIFYLGFAVISPKAAFDPMYIIRASSRELNAYMGSNVSRLSLVWTNLTSVLAYSMLYSGVPFMPVILVFCFVKRWNDVSFEDVTSTFFCRVLPLIITIFFIYNLCVTVLFMRTYYPFFFLSDLYVAVAIGDWFSNSRAKKCVFAVLCGFMVLRGAYYIYLMSDNTDSTRMANMITSAVDENWSKTTVLSGQIIYSDGYADYKNIQVTDINDPRFSDHDAIELEHGELFISSSKNHAMLSSPFSFLSLGYEISPDVQKWLDFEQTNEPYYVGQLYSNCYYYLFGSWIYGTTGAGYESPLCTIYYRS